MPTPRAVAIAFQTTQTNRLTLIIGVSPIAQLARLARLAVRLSSSTPAAWPHRRHGSFRRVDVLSGIPSGARVPPYRARTQATVAHVNAPVSAIEGAACAYQPVCASAEPTTPCCRRRFCRSLPRHVWAEINHIAETTGCRTAIWLVLDAIDGRHRGKALYTQCMSGCVVAAQPRCISQLKRTIE